MKRYLALFSPLLFGACLYAQGTAVAEEQLPVPSAAQASDHFDPLAATNAYLATVPPDKKARSDAYFEGGYWLLLWDFLASAAVYFLLLSMGWSARMRALAERITRFKPLQTFLYWVQFLAITSVIVFPFTAYRDFVREHTYGLATQTFGPWLGDKLKMLALGIVFGGLFLIVFYGVLRRAPRSWWIWGSVVTIVFQMFTNAIAPVYIAPLFNKYTELDDPRIKDPILSMARANGIPASNVYVMDASRQSTRVSANVSGFLGTERITLNDNLLKRCTLLEIEAVMGHEIGHYVLNHVYKQVLFFGVLTVLGFAFLRWGVGRALTRWDGPWRVRGVDDVAALPLFALLISIYAFVLTPITNTYIRTMEYEADIFGLNAANQPDGEALIDLKLGDYRKLDPGPVEEFVFFDHPSGRVRIHAAMRWKAEHLRSGH
jgi:STE24 endopeptidase